VDELTVSLVVLSRNMLNTKPKISHEPVNSMCLCICAMISSVKRQSVVSVLLVTTCVELGNCECFIPLKSVTN